MTSQPSSNADQTALWNGTSGHAWVDHQATLDRMFAPFEAILTDAMRAGKGQRVLDVGCGTGAVTLAAARHADDGECLGVDISAPMLALARDLAARLGVPARFVEGDAQTYAFAPASIDCFLSRFGVMFFDDPVAAFANIRRAARPGAGLAFAAFRSPAENDFLTTAPRAAAPLLPALPMTKPDAPGQFAFADGERVRSILSAGGWSAVELKPVDLPCTVNEDDLMAYVTRLGPVGTALRQADAATARKVTDVLRQAFARFVDGGTARFSTACWLATARA